MSELPNAYQPGNLAKLAKKTATSRGAMNMSNPQSEQTKQFEADLNGSIVRSGEANWLAHNLLAALKRLDALEHTKDTPAQPQPESSDFEPDVSKWPLSLQVAWTETFEPSPDFNGIRSNLSIAAKMLNDLRKPLAEKPADDGIGERAKQWAIKMGCDAFWRSHADFARQELRKQANA